MNRRSPAYPQNSGKTTFAEIKSAAAGRWISILESAGLTREFLNHVNGPCPKCVGTDRYNAAKDVADTGAVFCRKCFTKSSPIKPGDGIATVAWWRGISNSEAATWIANHIGLSAGPAEPVDIIVATARNKRMPVDAFRLFGVRAAVRGRERTPVARIDVYNPDGQVHSYFDLWPGAKGKSKRGNGNSGMFFPGRLPASGETWLLVEGVKDAAALVGLGFNAAGMPTCKLASKYAKLFTGVHVICVPDLDTAGLFGADETAGNLYGIAESIAVARLPGQVKESGGDDVRDVLKQPDGEALVREAIELAAQWNPSGDSINGEDRPEIIVTMNEFEVADQVVVCIGNLGWDPQQVTSQCSDSDRVFVRGGNLVHVIQSDDIGAERRLTIQTLPPCLVRERITQACTLVSEKENEFGVETTPVRPPKWLVDAVYQRGRYGGAVRPLSGIIDSPTIRLDGSVLQEPGYDQQTGLIYDPSIEFPPVPEEPQQTDAADALTILLDVLADFPMLDHADRSAWLTMVLSMIGRSCIDGHAPLFAVTANVRGAGKSLLVDAASVIAYGRPVGRTTFTRNEEEMRKVITATALAALPAVLFDNVEIQLGGSALDMALTSTTWNDRVLGESRMTGDLPIRTIWSATGNNMAFGTDIARRVLPIRLQSPLETPEDRSGFANPDLLAWVKSQRPVLAVAALTLLRAYFIAGCPPQPNGEWGSFQSWSATIRGAIVWAGGADPLSTKRTALAFDETAALLGKLIIGLEKADPYGVGLTTKQIELKTFGSGANSSDHEDLAEAVSDICGEWFNSRQFGRRLQVLTGRVWQGRFIDSIAAGGGVKRWRVRQSDGGFGGFGGCAEANASSDSVSSQDEFPYEELQESVVNHKLSGVGRPVTNPPKQPNQPSLSFADTSSTGEVVEL